MKIVIDIPESIMRAVEYGFCGQVLKNIVWQSLKSGTPLPEDATNGDVFQATFPNIDFKIDNEENVVDVKLGGFTEYAPIDLTWWSAPYKTERTDKE